MKKLLGLVLVAMLMLAACGGGGDSEPAADDEAQEQPADDATEEEAAEEAADVTGKAELEMEVDDFYFEPAALTGEAGQELTLVLENEGDAAHTVTIEDQDIDEELQAGDETEVTVTFPDSGSVEYICRFHVGGGMKGTLEVAG